MVEALRVLVVEDYPDVAEVLGVAVEQLGHTYMIARDGATALVLEEGFAPDVILLDVGLPDISGLELARMLRARGCTAYIAAVTGWAGDAGIRANESGVDRFLMKPAKREALRDVMMEGLRRRDQSPSS